jgi:transcriptional regulator with XRE-family HTH domain
VFFTNFNFIEIGERIRQVRGDLSQKLFGDSIGASRSYVNNIEHGSKPSIEFIANIGLVYGISLDWLMFGKEIQRPNNETDPDLKEMIDVLKRLLTNDNPDMRGWAKVQFQKTFGEHY